MSHPASANNLQIFNEVRFERMACGDLPGFVEMAEEFFADVRAKLVHWPSLRDAGDHARLFEEFHRCKGGAALFGLERLFSLLGALERDTNVGHVQVDLEGFESELAAAEEAVAGFRANPPDA